MKIYAITRSGNRQKDFVDIYFLLELFSMTEIIKAYCQKYPLSNEMLAIKSLSWFDDVDLTFDPPQIVRKITFSEVKHRIIEATKYPQKVFKY